MPSQLTPTPGATDLLLARPHKFTCSTNGNGLWSNEKKTVPIYRITVNYAAGPESQPDFGELRAYFDTDDWNTDYDGLIYTDEQWLAEFQLALVTLLGFSNEASAEVGYSEQGMQGYDYVSMDILGSQFLREWKRHGYDFITTNWCSRD